MPEVTPQTWTEYKDWLAQKLYGEGWTLSRVLDEAIHSGLGLARVKAHCDGYNLSQEECRARIKDLESLVAQLERSVSLATATNQSLINENQQKWSNGYERAQNESRARILDLEAEKGALSSRLSELGTEANRLHARINVLLQQGRVREDEAYRRGYSDGEANAKLVAQCVPMSNESQSYQHGLSLGIVHGRASATAEMRQAVLAKIENLRRSI